MKARFKKLACRLFGHRVTLDVLVSGMWLRLRCVRCGMQDPWHQNQFPYGAIDNRASPLD